MKELLTTGGIEETQQGRVMSDTPPMIWHDQGTVTVTGGTGVFLVLTIAAQKVTLVTLILMQPGSVTFVVGLTGMNRNTVNASLVG